MGKAEKTKCFKNKEIYQFIICFYLVFVQSVFPSNSHNQSMSHKTTRPLQYVTTART